MKPEKRKTPADYATFSFRITEEEKSRIIALIEATKRRLNASRNMDEKLWKNNTVIIHALHRGLRAMQRLNRNYLKGR